ncbi:MAG: FxsA family protein [Sphingomonadales bacterium]
MGFIILLALLALPFIEITLFIEAGRAVGIMATLALTILTAVGGIAIVRHQGLNNLRRMRAATEKGEPPIAEMVHGVLLLVAGLFLLIPGFFTDAAGALLLIPPIRALLGARLLRSLSRRNRKGGSKNTGADVVDVEYWEEGDLRSPPRVGPPRNDDDSDPRTP